MSECHGDSPIIGESLIGEVRDSPHTDRAPGTVDDAEIRNQKSSPTAAIIPTIG